MLFIRFRRVLLLKLKGIFSYACCYDKTKDGINSLDNNGGAGGGPNNGGLGRRQGGRTRFNWKTPKFKFNSI